LLVEFLRAIFVFPLFRSEIIQQLADAGVLCPRRRLLVKTARLDLHCRGLFAHRFNPQRTNQPQCRTLNKSAHILPPDQRNMVAELLLIELQQPASMPGLLFAHAFKH